jgi:hypothetical protein
MTGSIESPDQLARATRRAPTGPVAVDVGIKVVVDEGLVVVDDVDADVEVETEEVDVDVEVDFVQPDKTIRKVNTVAKTTLIIPPIFIFTLLLCFVTPNYVIASNHSGI